MSLLIINNVSHATFLCPAALSCLVINTCKNEPAKYVLHSTYIFTIHKRKSSYHNLRIVVAVLYIGPVTRIVLHCPIETKQVLNILNCFMKVVKRIFDKKIYDTYLTYFIQVSCPLVFHQPNVCCKL